MNARRVFAYLFIVGAVAAGAVQNVKFAQSLSGEDGATNWPFMAGVALAAAGKVGIPIFERWYRNVWLAVMFAACVAFDLLCAYGYGALTRGSRLEEYESATRLHYSRGLEVARIERELAALPVLEGPARSEAAEANAMHAAAARMSCLDRAGKIAATRDCTVALASLSGAVVAARDLELKAAERRAQREKLAGDLDAARKALELAPLPTKSPDPQAAQLAKALGISERSASMIQTYFLAAIIEASLFGGAAALELSGRDKTPPPPGPGSPKRTPPAPQGPTPGPKSKASGAAILALLRGIRDGKIPARGLTVAGGAIEGPLEAWAAALGIASKSTARRRLSELAAIGDIKATFGRSGTRVEIS